MIGRRWAAVGVVTAAVTVGGVAGALIGIPGLSGASSSSTVAQSTSASNTHGGHHRGFGGGPAFGAIGANRDVIDTAAKALNLSTSALLQKLSDGKTTIADVAQQQNVPLSTVTAAMEKVADSDISKLVNNPLPTRPTFKGGGPMGGSGAVGGSGASGGFAGRFGPGMGIGFGGGLGGSIGSVAKTLGISTQDLFKDLAGGQSIAAIAKSKNVDINTIINTLVTDSTSGFNAAVKAGHLSQADATKIESNLQGEITKLVNGSLPKGFGGFGMLGGFGGFGGQGGGRSDHGGYGHGGHGSGGPTSTSTPSSTPASAS